MRACPGGDGVALILRRPGSPRARGAHRVVPVQRAGPAPGTVTALLPERSWACGSGSSWPSTAPSYPTRGGPGGCRRRRCSSTSAKRWGPKAVRPSAAPPRGTDWRSRGTTSWTARLRCSRTPFPDTGRLHVDGDCLVEEGGGLAGAATYRERWRRVQGRHTPWVTRRKPGLVVVRVGDHVASVRDRGPSRSFAAACWRRSPQGRWHRLVSIGPLRAAHGSSGRAPGTTLTAPF